MPLNVPPELRVIVVKQKRISGRFRQAQMSLGEACDGPDGSERGFRAGALACRGASAYQRESPCFGIAAE